MKILLPILFSLALAVAVVAQSQATSSQSSGQSSASQNSQSGQSQGTQGQAGQSQSGQNMTGTVSKDRKSFTSDKDNKSYTVDNPDALQGQGGQHVALLVAVDPTTNTIHVVQLQAPPQ